MANLKPFFIILFAILAVAALGFLAIRMTGLFAIGDISEMYAPHTTEGSFFNVTFAGYNIVYEHCGNQYFVMNNGSWVQKDSNLGGKLRSVKRSGVALNISGIIPYYDQILDTRVFPDEAPRCTNIPVEFFLLGSSITPAAMTHYDYSVLVQPSSNANGGNRITSEILPHVNKDLIEINQTLTSAGYSLKINNADKAYRARAETVFTTSGGGQSLRSKEFEMGLGVAQFALNTSGLLPEKALTSVFLELEGNNQSWYNIETINLPEKLKSNLTSTTAVTTTTTRAGNSTNTTTTTLIGGKVTISSGPWYIYVGGLLIAGLVVAGFWFAIGKMGGKK